MKHPSLLALPLVLALAAGLFSCTGGGTRISESAESFRTYPFSDPDPVPTVGIMWPYFRYDGFTSEAAQQDWTVVTLENEFLKIKILPQIGGKVWSVVDKRTGGEMFYDNDVVKFRDISMRGPWTSGGIEFNYGILGHAPSCSFPVSYKTVRKADGSVSCYIGTLDMLSRSRWTIEINLAAGSGKFTTRSIWHNGSPLHQPYYNWVNAGVTATDDLNLVYPAAYWIGHGAEKGSWPMDGDIDLRIWRNLDYGGSKSFHMAGVNKTYFGTWWAASDFGIIHYSAPDEKLGRKFFTWALNDSGDLWEELLTDDKGYYVELQSGRLFNQNMKASSTTPFRQYLLEPYATERWCESWYPYSGTGGVSDATGAGVVRLERKEPGCVLHFYPAVPCKGKLQALDPSGKAVFAEEINLGTGELFVREIAAAEIGRVVLDGAELYSPEVPLARPSTLPEAFDPASVQGMTLMARDLIGMRRYAEAEPYADGALAKDPCFIPALGLKALLCNLRFEYRKALEFSSSAIAVDQYDAMANFQAGIAHAALGDEINAADCFTMAAQTAELREAAWVELAKSAMRRGDAACARDYALKAIGGNEADMTALEILALASDAAGDGREAAEAARRIEDLDPLSRFPAILSYLAGKTGAEKIRAGFREEFPWQDILETACLFHGLGMDADAAKVLGLIADPNALVCVWKSFLTYSPESLSSLQDADVDFAFPFRDESRAALLWAVGQGGGWKASWMLALLEGSRGNLDRMKEILGSLSPDYAPFYAFRARYAATDAERIADAEQAVKLVPDEWRYRKALVEALLKAGRPEEAAAEAGPFLEAHPDGFAFAAVAVRAMLASGRLEKADKILTETVFLPFEGQNDIRNLYHKVKIFRAVEALERGDREAALRFLDEDLQWPHNIGVGRPYDDQIDTRLNQKLRDAALGKSSLASVKSDPLFRSL